MIKTKTLKRWIGYLCSYGLQYYALPGKCVAFTFHRVLTQTEYQNTRFQRSIAVRSESLRHFISHIDQHYNIISIQQWLDHIQGKHPLSPKHAYAVITFDDGWNDNYTNAFPILKAMGVPATIFLSTDYIESSLGFWWQHLGEALVLAAADPNHTETVNGILQKHLNAVSLEHSSADTIIQTIKQHAYEKAQDITTDIMTQMGTPMDSHGLNWAACQEMSGEGISFGSHTLSHPRLSLLTQKDCARELEKSKALLMEKNLNYVDSICYPYGDYIDSTLEAAARYYPLGFTTDTGLAHLSPANVLRIPRINVPDEQANDIGLLNYRLARAAMKGR